MILFKKYTMCHLETQREICSSFRRRNLQRGFACGPCTQSNSDLPSVGEVRDLVDYRETTTLELKISSQDNLSTMWLITNRGKQVPVARSYLGNDWESYPGRFSKLQFQCDGTMCSTRLPAMSRAFKIRYGKYTYQLATFRHSPGRDVEVARFLEQGTFGPTRDEIDSFPESFAEWIQQQQEVPLSSHRQMFRKHLNHRFETPTIHGISTHACAAGTRYRNFAFSDKDKYKKVEIRTDELGRKVFLIDNQVRTVVNVTTLYAGPASNNAVYTDGS